MAWRLKRAVLGSSAPVPPLPPTDFFTAAQTWHSRGNGLGGTDPTATTSGVLMAEWDLPRKYTQSKNGSDNLFVTKFLFKWSSTPGGPYVNVIDTGQFDDPANPRLEVYGFQVGAPVYAVVSVVDHAGVESGDSPEVVFTPDRAAPYSPPELFTEITPADLPITLTAPGAYRLSGSFTNTQTDAAMINIAGDDIELFKVDGARCFYGSGTYNSAIELFGSPARAKIHGFDLKHDGFLSSSGVTENCAGILGRSNDPRDIEIFNNTIEHGVSFGSAANNTGSYGPIVLRDGDWSGRIHHNAISSKGVARGANRCISGAVLPGNVMRIDNNDIDYGDNNDPLAYLRVIVGGTEIDSNTFNGVDIDMSSLGFIPIQPSDGAFIHGNTFSSLRTSAGRYINLEQGSKDTVSLYNKFLITDGFNHDSAGNRAFRARFGATNHVIGHNTYEALGTTPQTDARAVMLIVYGDETIGQPWDGVAPNKVYSFNNTITDANNGMYYCQEIAEDCHGFGNVATGGFYGARFRSADGGANQHMINFSSTNDLLQGSVSDVVMNAGLASPAIENAHFSPQPLPYSIDTDADTVRGVDYFEQGDAGWLNISPHNYALDRVPETPTGLKELI